MPTPFNLLRIPYHDADAPTRFAESLHETGFAVLSHSPLSPALVATVYREWATFFASEAKYDYTYKPQEQSGYFPYLSEHAKDSQQPDLKEFYHLYPWSVLPTGVSQQTRELFSQLLTLAQELLTWLEQYCPPDIQQKFSQPLQTMVAESPQTLMRILHYPPLDESVAAGAVRAAAHEDVNLLTLLPAATALGLEVRSQQGDWYVVPSDPGDLIVNVGDMLQLASQGFYRSTTHRVVNPMGSAANQSRYSMPLFLHPKPDVSLTENVTARQFLQQRLREIGLLSES
jgi:isopenicillin N synthase-like dioxygenase